VPRWYDALASMGDAEGLYQAAKRHSEATQSLDVSDATRDSGIAKAASFAVQAALQGHHSALCWLGGRMRLQAVQTAAAKAAPGSDGILAGAEAFIQSCVQAATAAGDRYGDAAYGALVQRRTAAALRSPELDAAHALAAQGANDGSTWATVQLADMLGRGIGCELDRAGVWSWLQRAAEGGHPVAAYRVEAQKLSTAAAVIAGERLEHGDACACDVEGAMHLFQAAADGGSAPGKVALGRMLRGGLGKQDSLSAGVKGDALWAEVEAGDDGAGLAALAAALDDEQEGDTEEGVQRVYQLNIRALKLGSVHGQVQLAEMLELGRGCTADQLQADRLYVKSANGGHGWAAYKVGHIAIRENRGVHP